MPRVEPAFTKQACFTVNAPEMVVAGEYFLLEAYVHTKGNRDEIDRWSALRGGRKFTSGTAEIAVGAKIAARVTIPGVTIDADAGSLRWDGEIGMVQFTCAVPARAKKETFAGSVAFAVRGVMVAETRFVLTVAQKVGPMRDLGAAQRVVSSAFASYASPDRRKVLARIQGMQKVVPFLDVFLDAVTLRSGQLWQKALREEILKRDVLLLFWSRAAAKSEWVDREWRIALRAKGRAGIGPVPLEAPSVAPPPKALKNMHFNDWTLMTRAR